jgi:hypothetical protein
MRRFLLALLTAALACGTDDLVGNEGFTIACGEEACDWTVVEGQPTFGPSWHDGDPGLDLSAPGRAVVEQRAAPFDLPSRELILEAAVARDPGARVRFEIDWYVAGAAAGATYWDRAPVLVATRGVDVEREGVHAIEALVSTPSLEVTGLVLRIIKEGDGRAIVDEIALRERNPEVIR